MKQTFDLVTFEISDGVYSQDHYIIFKKDTTNMNESEIIKEAWGEYFPSYDPRKVRIYSTQKITKEEVDTLQKLHIADINY